MNTEHKKMAGLPENSKVTSQNENLPHYLFEDCPDALVRITAAGNITEINQAMADITGLHPEDLIGTVFCNQFIDSEEMDQITEDVFAAGSAEACLQMIKSKTDESTNVLCNGSVYTDAAGNVLGAVFVIKDF